MHYTEAVALLLEAKLSPELHAAVQLFESEANAMHGEVLRLRDQVALDTRLLQMAVRPDVHAMLEGRLRELQLRYDEAIAEVSRLREENARLMGFKAG